MKAFTLVELIVVVTILAILATIGFVSYSGYLTGVRDTNRIASLTAISDGLELYRTRNDLPDPDDAVDIQVEGIDIAHQGYVGSNVLQTIEYSKAGKDPKDDSYYSYYLTDDKKYYQLMAFLEESDNLETALSPGLSSQRREGNFTYSPILEGVNGVDYKSRHPKVYGKRLGILTDTDNTPVQELITGALDFTSTSTGEYVAHMTDMKVISGSGSKLKFLKVLSQIGGNFYKSVGIHYSCKHILDSGKSTGNGVYTIRPDGNNNIDVYCDMTTAGGGWTLLFNRKAETGTETVNNIEDCGINVDDFINGGMCGSVDNITQTSSYSLGGDIKSDITNFVLLSGDIEYMVSQLLDTIHDADDTFIISSNEDIFPNVSFPIRNISVNSICNLSASCDTDNVIWKYAGTYHYSNTYCNGNSIVGPTYKGSYGYCLDGLDNSVSDIGLGGDRFAYSQVKLWNHSNGADDYQEKVFIR